MNILLRESGEVTIVEVAGEITAATAPLGQAKVLAAVKPGGKMILDMSGVTFMASAGLRILLMTHRTITGRNGQVILAGIPETLKDTLRNVGFLDLLTHRDTLDEALAALTSRDGGGP